MITLLQNVTLLDTSSPFNNKKVCIKIKGDTIIEIDSIIKSEPDFHTINLDNLYVSKGWFDTSVCLGEPGYEERATISNGLQVAAKSGFTAIALQPNTFPTLDNQVHIKWVLDKAKNAATTLFPIGALTKNSKGTELAEMYDMKTAGAIAFGDYKKALQNTNLQKIALQYAQNFNGLIISHSEDYSLKGKGVANESETTTKIGLKGIPELAEEIHIARNLCLLEYTGGKLHIPTISTQKSVALIREAKAKGLQVTCSVAVHHLTLTDTSLTTFDTRYKVTPPLRNEATRKALIEAVKEGVIDCITTDHNPLDIELKKLEFDLATEGTIGLESAFGALLNVLPLPIVIEKLTAGRTIFEQKEIAIAVGNKANLSLFNPTKEWVFTKDTILSKSKNSAFLNHKMKGKAIGIFNNGKLILND